MATMRILAGLAAVSLSFAVWSTARAQEQEQEPPAPPAPHATSADQGESKPPLAAWIPAEGFRIRSASGNYQLRIGLNMGVKYEPTFEPSGNNWANFPFAFVRPRLDGHIFRPWIRFWVQLELSRFPPSLIDGFIEIEPWNFFGARAGLQFTPLSRHESFGPSQLLFPEWTLTANYFWTGYQRGITLYGNNIGDRLTYYAGFYDGTSTRQNTSVPGNFVVLARLTYNPIGRVLENEMPYVTAKEKVPFRFGFTLQGDYGRTSITDINLNPSSGLLVGTLTGAEQTQALGAADFVFQVGRISFLSEFYYRHVNPMGVVTPSFDQLGAWAQLGYVFYKRILVAGLRFNWIQPNLSLGHDQAFTGEAMLAWWISAPNLSLKLRYEIGHQQDPGAAPAGDPGFFDFVEIPLEVGTSQLVTLQATVTF